MRKPRASLVEVYNDLDGEIVGLFRALRDPAAAARLADLIQRTPFARAEFDLSYEPSDDPIEQARRTVVRSFFGFGSDSASGAKTGFRANGNRQTAHPAKDWGNLPSAIATFCDRLRGVVIENREAVEVLLQHDSPETLHYCDPTYLPETRSLAVLRTGKGYRHEMTREDHERLAEALHAAQGMVILSAYPSDLYDALYRDWTAKARRALADGGLVRTEVLWLNPACVKALDASRSQQRLIA